MKADFSGYATRHNIRCADGRTIMPNAFKHNDSTKVPLVWQHQHNDPANILGHALLESRSDGVYAYAFFNETPSAQNAKTLVKHGDVSALSIYANNLTEKGKDVHHGNIREVSLVLSGANPGAFIDNVNLSHADGNEVLDEAVIYSGLELEHSDPFEVDLDNDGDDDDDQDAETGSGSDTVQGVLETLDDEQREVVHHLLDEALTHGDMPDDQSEETVEAVQAAFASFTDEQREVVHHMLSEAIIHGNNQGDTMSDTLSHAGEKTVKDVFDSMTEEQQNVVYFMIGEALDGAKTGGSVAQSDSTEALSHALQEGFSNMRNVFEQNGTPAADRPTLSHSQLEAIVSDAQKTGSFKEAFLAHTAEYGIENIDFLFPDAKSLTNTPDVIGRRTEWVADVINSTKHSPFSRIKSTAVDLTADQARAKGYVKGNLKKDEIIKLLKRVTTPTTIYKKQKLDRDDIVDITDLDVVAWLKAEMRLMLDEELARAVLIGDGREPDDEDKIDEDKLRPIAWDNDMYAHSITVASDLSPEAIIETVLRARTYYKGTGTPNWYTTDAILTDLILLKDKMGRRLYETEEALAAALRVGKIVTVEVMESNPNILGIMVNMADYTLGADRGGAVSMFDDFDIDYNQHKYLIETRVSGALTKPKSAVVVKRTVGTVVTPVSPSFDGATNTITIPAIEGVVYTIDGATVSGSVVIDETTEVESRPATGYSFPHNTDRDWVFVYTAPAA